MTASRHERITSDPGIMQGKPCIRGTRVPVELVLEKLGAGLGAPEVLDAYPRLTREDVQAALLFAADVVRSEEIQLATQAPA